MITNHRTLLHLDSSASGPRDSVSRQLTGQFADLWRERNGTDGYRYRDLVADPVPHITAGYPILGQRVERCGTVPLDKVAEMAEGADEEREWARTLPLVNELLTADTVLIGVPMYNLSISAALKAWIDRVSFPGVYTDPGTGESLLRGTQVVLLLTRGGGYGPGTPMQAFDFQTPYLRAYFARLGVDRANLRLVQAELTRAGDIPALAQFQELAADSLAAARAAVTELVAVTEPAAQA